MIELRNSCSRILGRSVVIAWGIVLSIGLFGPRLEALEQAVSTSPGSEPDVAPTPAVLLTKWEEYLSKFGEVACEYRAKEFRGTSPENLKGSETFGEFTTVIATNNGCAFIRTFPPKNINEDSTTDVEVLNDKYAFYLRRKASGNVDLYELDAETPVDVLQTDSETFHTVRSMTKGAFGTSAPRLLLPEVLRHRSFKFQSVSKTPEGDWLLLFDCEVPAHYERVFYARPARTLGGMG